MTDEQNQAEYEYRHCERLAILTKFLPSGISEREPDKAARQIARTEACEWVFEHGGGE